MIYYIKLVLSNSVIFLIFEYYFKQDIKSIISNSITSLIFSDYLNQNIKMLFKIQ